MIFITFSMTFVILPASPKRAVGSDVRTLYRFRSSFSKLVVLTLFAPNSILFYILKSMNLDSICYFFKNHGPRCYVDITRKCHMLLEQIRHVITS